MPLDLNNRYGGHVHVPEDKDQALVVTPYGKGQVIRTRKDKMNGNVLMREIELSDWKKPSNTKGPEKPSLLYSTTNFPSQRATAGSEVLTMYGRGKVVEIRDDWNSTHVVRISSWRLASRSTVTCYLSPTCVQVVRPRTISEMSVYEKVEQAQAEKQEATLKFASKDYQEALHLYSKAVDTVRFVQHKKDSTNELRADLLVVMITCCNNAATCCIQLSLWDRAYKFGMNALVLLDALYDKRGNSKIHSLLNKDGFVDSQLFGAWKVKSYLVIARGLAEKHETQQAITTLKPALVVIAEYKKEGDDNYQQLSSQEKTIRKLLMVCRERLKAELKKEKQRAIAMFGGGSSPSEEKKDAEKKKDVPTARSTPATTNGMTPSRAAIKEIDDTKLDDIKSVRQHDPTKRRVSFADNSKPGDYGPEEKEDDDDEPSFLEENKEALFVLGGLAIGSALVGMLWRRNR
jgi:hypothetical protein